MPFKTRGYKHGAPLEQRSAAGADEWIVLVID